MRAPAAAVASAEERVPEAEVCGKKEKLQNCAIMVLEQEYRAERIVFCSLVFFVVVVFFYFAQLLEKGR